MLSCEVVLSGKLIQLVDKPAENAELRATIIDQINDLNPPKPLTLDEIYVRECELVGDAMTDHNARFRTEDIEKILRLTNGAPLLIGHQKDTAPFGKFFGGRTAMKDTVKWAIPMFYWHKKLSFAEDLKYGIDSGIYNYASIGIRFNLPTCSICGEDIRRCDHISRKLYDGEKCFMWFDDIAFVT